METDVQRRKFPIVRSMATTASGRMPETERCSFSPTDTALTSGACQIAPVKDVDKLTILKIHLCRYASSLVAASWRNALGTDFVVTKLLTTIIPQGGDQLEILVMEIMRECGMSAERRVKKMTARGKAEVDVIATEEIRGITHTIAFECKNLNRRVDQGVVHTFRSILNDAGIHQGYIVSRMGFQKGAYAAADFTNITLCSFQDFQERFFKKWCDRRLLFLNVRFQFLENFFLRQMWRRWVDFCFNDDESRQAYLNHVDRFRYLYASVVDTIVPFDKDRDIDVMELHRTTIDKMVAHDLEIPPDFNAVVDLRSLVNTLCSHIDRAVKVDLYELNPCVGKVLLAGLDQAIKQSEDILGI